MIHSLIALMSLVIVASILQTNFKIPSPITLMSIILGGLALGTPIFHLNGKEFDSLVLITLPLLIAADALKLKLSDLKMHGFSLFWVAVVSVLLSIGFGISINHYLLVDYPLSIAAVVLLFCMVSATDPITVSAIFQNFNVPHKLKVLTEGESLFNDATALIVFSIALVALQSPEQVSVGFITMKTITVVGGAAIIGILLGMTTVQLLKTSNQPLVETTILLLSAYLAFIAAEHFHCSGILAVIVDIVIANKVIHDILDRDIQTINTHASWKNFGLMHYTITSKDNQEIIIKSIDFISMFASAALFVSIAAIANFEKLFHYKNEILIIFAASTVIRGIMMLKFAFLSNKVSQMQNINARWWAVLTFAGSKGALSILMVHMIPNTFAYKELFENIIIGNILLSTFIYAGILAIIIVKNQKAFDHECVDEHH